MDGRFIRSRRENANITQEALASRCGLTRTLIQKAERGGPLSKSSIRTIAGALEISENSLVLEEDWSGSADEWLTEPFKPASEGKIGNAWSQPRETLYSMPPRQLLVVALRSVARIAPAYGPRSADAAAHCRRLMSGIDLARDTLDSLFRDAPPKTTAAALRKSADHAYLAAGFARPAEYHDDCHAADAAFAVAIGMARVLDALHIVTTTPAPATGDANYWRAVEFATSACHASAHASVYLRIPEPFLRSATLDTHDIRNLEDTARLLAGPVWDGGQIPPPLELFLNRFIPIQHFDSNARARWFRWSRTKFA